MSRCTRPLRVLLLAAVAAGLAGSVTAATLTVDTVDDADAVDGTCSLREAILAANDDLPHNDCPAGDGADRIVFDLTTPAEIDLTADLPMITETLMIQGIGANELAIDGNDLHRMLHFDTATGGWFGVERLTLYRGLAPGGASGDGGGAYVDVGETAYFHRVRFRENRSLNAGGGLAVGSGTGSLVTTTTVTECLFADNVAEGPAGGGGLAMVGTGGEVRVLRSTFVGNIAEHANGSGGGLAAYRGLLALEASTVSGNSANANGGGILVLVSGAPPLSGTLSLRDTTVTANTANLDGDLAGEGGGIAFLIGSSFVADLELVNSVVAGNIDTGGAENRPDLHCSGTVVLAAAGAGYIGSNESCDTIYPSGSPNANGDWVGTAASTLDPLLLPLADNGGPLPTHEPEATPPELGALLAFSPLIDSGNCPAAVTDQRGFGTAATGMRLRDHPDVPDAASSDGCDIGAVEVGTVRIDRTIFADGFESGTTLLWSHELEP